MSGYKYITRSPETTELDGKSVGFDWFVSWLLDNDHERFNSTGDGLRARSRIEIALKEIGPLRLTPEDQKRLSESANGPKQLHPARGDYLMAYPTLFAAQWLPHINAIDAATDTPPAVLKVPEPPPAPVAV
jgi:hypothetical protein